MFSRIFLAFFLSFQPSIAQEISSDTRDCIEDFLFKGGNAPTITDSETRRIGEIRENFDAMRESLSNLANNTVVLDARGEVLSFRRFRRDEVLYTAVFLCLDKNGPK